MTLQTIEPVLYLPDDTAFYPDPGDERHGLRLLVRAGGLAVLCFVVYLPVLIWGKFVWQDDVRVTQNMFLWSWGGLAAAWGHPLGGWYRPLAQSVLWAEHHFFHSHALGYHLAGVLFHAANAGLLWMVLRRLGIRGAWLAAALFAAHPMQVQSVAWISQQSHLIGGAFFVGAAWAFLRVTRIQPPLPEEFAPSPGHDWEDLMPVEPLARLYALSLVLAIAASLSDPIGVALPFVLALLIWWKRGTVTRADWLRLGPLFFIAIGGAVLAGVMAARGNSADLAGAGPALTIAQRLLVDARAIAWYAGAVVCPYPLLFVYARWAPVSWASGQIVFPIALMLIVAGAWAARRRVGRAPLAAVLLFVALLSPGLGAVLGTARPAIYVADHWIYLAIAVPAAVVGWALVTAISRFSAPSLERGLRVGMAMACLAGLGFVAWEQGTIYDREEHVWQDALAEQPGSSVAIVGYTRLLLSQGNDLKASKILRTAAASGPPDVALLQARAQVYMMQGRYAEASEDYLAAHRLEPDNEQITIGLAQAYARDGRAEEAMTVYHDALRLHPDDPAMLNDIGLLLMSQGKFDEAIGQLESAIKANPRFVAARINLVKIYLDRARQGKTRDQVVQDMQHASEQLKQVIAIDPLNYYAFYDAGVALYDARDFYHAEQMFRAAVSAQPNASDAWDKLGIVQAAQGKERLNEAVWNFDHAVHIDPNNLEARQHLESARRNIASIDNK